MARPIEATSALDLDTIMILLWASEQGTGNPNISRLFDQELADGLDLSRGTFFNAVKGRKVTQHVLDKVDELIALRGWRAKWLEHCREVHKQRVIKAFDSAPTYCSVCGHGCTHCGLPKTEKRRQAVKSFLRTDPIDLGCKVREHVE
jgi:ribosomal protein L37E